MVTWKSGAGPEPPSARATERAPVQPDRREAQNSASLSGYRGNPPRLAILFHEMGRMAQSAFTPERSAAWATGAKLFLCGLLGFFDLRNELFRVLVEILLAILATQFDFTVLVREHVGIAHPAKFLVRNRTDLERIGFGFL